MKLLSSQFLKSQTVKSIGKKTQKLLVDKYVTYAVAVITIVIVSESVRNPDQTFLLLLKDFCNIFIIKIAVIILSLYVGYYNQVLGILILINLFFITNIKEKIELFVSKIPNLIDKNKALKYDKYIKSPLGDSKNQSQKVTKSPRLEKKENDNETKNQEKTVTESKSKVIDNPIKIKESRELKGESIDQDNTEKIEKEVEILTQKINKEEVETDDFNTDVEDSPIDRKKKKIYLNYYHKNNKIKKKGLDDTSFGERGDEDILNKKSLQEHEQRKEQKKKIKEDLIDDLKKVEKEQLESERLEDSKDKTLESRIKNSNYEKRRNLKILEENDEDDSSSSESSDSSSSESSSDSDREYEDVSLTEAREHVLKKLRNKMKKNYAQEK